MAKENGERSTDTSQRERLPVLREKPYARMVVLRKIDGDEQGNRDDLLEGQENNVPSFEKSIGREPRRRK
ncbi:hypothetical protein M404DRAFT_1004956 [Pisolithus tinctorius Marx 270]|uniref:Uncharacterized protein n=1 Tax=Pisolithus tinctorius Marx 270 TaxID=870435 RepID=A0A0C3NUJ7_PISTI|nr:hypothetical protein M404DRAFT_1004956 [Pisolithus tinctorius Marx 270]